MSRSKQSPSSSSGLYGGVFSEALSRALAVLREGGVLLYPTDTVWGLGCDASCREAVRRIFAIKRRSDAKSLVLLAADGAMTADYVGRMPSAQEMDLLRGDDPARPLTVIYPGARVASGGSELKRSSQAASGLATEAAFGGRVAVKGLAPEVVAADGSVGIRVPDSAFCLQLLRAFGRPIVSTSANFSGEPAPADFSAIDPALKAAVDYVVPETLERGATGRPSRIVKLDPEGGVIVLRA